ncbi:hypothetical protein PG997_014421 [Apiospora hydei]|uniref:Uncharacterized protein n=1 Tax=Apiospora hydei TaxID=1337664 RepID=A0ABR1UTR4_9PEZI
MEVALTFGSVGDIIAICQIAIQLSRALGVGCAEASGSAKEYQDLRKDLDAFTHIKVREQRIAISTLRILWFWLTIAGTDTQPARRTLRYWPISMK